MSPTQVKVPFLGAHKAMAASPEHRQTSAGGSRAAKETSRRRYVAPDPPPFAQRPWSVLTAPQASTAKRPVIGDVYSSPDLGDRRVLASWLLLAASVASFAFWIAAATSVSRIPAAAALRPARLVRPSGVKAPAAGMPARDEAASLARRVSADVWFSLSLTAAADAIAVVGTFNGALIRRFHYAVSQRIMFLASAASFAVLQWAKPESNFVSRHPVASLALGAALYWLFGLALDKLERRPPRSDVLARWGTLQKYSRDLGFVDTSWARALFLTAVVGGVGLGLTMSIAPPWSGLVPILHILFEVRGAPEGERKTGAAAG